MSAVEPVKSPPTESSPFERAQVLVGARKWAEAREILEPLLARNALVPGVLSFYCRAVIALSDREGGLQRLIAAQSVASPRAAEALADRVRLLSSVFLTSEHSQAFEEATGWIEGGEWKRAVTGLKILAEKEPGNAAVLLRLGQAFALGENFEEAQGVLSRAQTLNPFEPEVLLWRGRVLYRLGRHPGAIDDLKKAHRGLKESENAAVWLSEALAGAGQRASALQVLEQHLKYHPQHLQALVQLARLRVLFYEKDLDMLWSARREIQVGLSRLPLYLEGAHARTEGELGVQLGTREGVRSSLISLLGRIESRLDGAASQ